MQRSHGIAVPSGRPSDGRRPGAAGPNAAGPAPRCSGGGRRFGRGMRGGPAWIGILIALLAPASYSSTRSWARMLPSSGYSESVESSWWSECSSSPGSARAASTASGRGCPKTVRLGSRRAGGENVVFIQARRVCGRIETAVVAPAIGWRGATCSLTSSLTYHRAWDLSHPRPGP